MTNYNGPGGKLDEELCLAETNTGFNLYKWAEENPDKAIAHAVKRTEKIFDESDEVFFGFSGGKDSSATAHLAVLELKRRWARVKAGVDRNGNEGIDPLDQKWVGKKLWGNSMDGEWIFSDTYNHIMEFTREHGPGVYEINGKEYSGGSYHKTSNGDVLTMREIYERAQNGEEFDIVEHLKA